MYAVGEVSNGRVVAPDGAKGEERIFPDRTHRPFFLLQGGRCMRHPRFKKFKLDI